MAHFQRADTAVLNLLVISKAIDDFLVRIGLYPQPVLFVAIGLTLSVSFFRFLLVQTCMIFEKFKGKNYLHFGSLLYIK